MEVSRQIQTIQEIKLAQAQTTINEQRDKILDAQEVAANLVIDGIAKNAEILDLKEIVAELIIKDGSVA